LLVFCSFKDILELLISEKHATHVRHTYNQISAISEILKAEKYFPKLATSETKDAKAAAAAVAINIEVTKPSISTTSNFAKLIKTFCSENISNKKSSPQPEKCFLERKIPPIDIKLNDEDGNMFECEIIHFKHPGEFYIKPKCVSNDEYEDLQKRLLQYYQSNVFSAKNRNDYLTAIRYKSQFYRACRISSYRNENMMYLIDLGIYLNRVQNSDIYRLADQFYKLPAKVVQCSLYGVESNTKDKKWSIQAIDWFKRELHKHDSILVGTHQEHDVLKM